MQRNRVRRPTDGARAPWLAAGVLTAALLAGAGAAAQDETADEAAPVAPPEPPEALTIDIDGWQGGAQTVAGQPNQISYCGVAREYENGVTLVIAINLEGFSNISLVNPDWSLTPQEQTTASLDIDQQITGEGPLVNAGETVRLLLLGDDNALIEALKRGSTLTLGIEGESYSFPLTGTFNALEAVNECLAAAGPFMEEIAAFEATLAEAAGIEGADGAAPDGAAAPDGSQPAPDVPRDGIPIGALNEFLAIAGIEDVRFVPPERVPEGPLELLHIWQVGESLNGALHQRRRQSEDVALEPFAEDYIGRLTGECPGEVTTELAPMEVFHDRFALQTGTLSCETEEAASFLAIVFALDEFFYSAFYHESSRADADAAAAESAKIAALIRQLAGSSQPPPDGDAPADEGEGADDTAVPDAGDAPDGDTPPADGN